MFITAMILLQLESFPDEASFDRACPSREEFREMLQKTQYLHSGMAPGEIDRALTREPKSNMPSFESIVQLRRQRQKDAAQMASLRSSSL